MLESISRREFLSTALGLLLFAGCSKTSPSPAREEMVAERLVSLSPSITETLYALGAEDRLIGVSRFCKYPPAAMQKPKVGGRLDPNVEAIFKLKPDVVLIPAGAVDLIQKLEPMGLRTLELPQNTVEDVFETIRLLGNLCGRQTEADALERSLKERLEKVRQEASQKPARRALLVVGRNYASEQLEDVYITGQDGLCSVLLQFAGGTNAYTGRQAFPKISVEGILSLNPEVIVEITPTVGAEDLTPEKLRGPWQNTLPQLEAVKKGRLVFLENEPPLLPSPSMVDWTENLAAKLSQLD